MAKVDLHCHSTASDGILNPADLVSSAKHHGVALLALTDHDTVAGVEEAQSAARRAGIGIVPGIEFSARWSGVGIHILGLQVQTDSAVLQQAVAGQAQVRQRRAETIARRLARRGIRDSLAGARALAGEGQIGRLHFARFLVGAGHVDSVKAAFRRYLKADVKQLWPEAATVIDWIHAAGGCAVLAHPRHYKMTNNKLKRCLGDFVAAGGDGMEVICGSQAPAVTDYLARLSRDFDLYASAGSDFHGPISRWQKPGAFGTLPALCRPLPL